MDGNVRLCRFLLLYPSIATTQRADVWCAALGYLRRADKRITSHRCQRAGILRGGMDHSP